MTKSWKIKSAEGKRFEFKPVFEISPDGQDIECKVIKIEIDNKDYTFNFINLFQFIYFICNEELRRGLALRYERRIHRIPYEVSFKLDKEEAQKGFTKRRIELPVDELTIAIAKQEAFKLRPNILRKIGKLG